MSSWSCEEHYEQNVRRIQLPYSVTLNTEQQRERRKELARRLMEINARKREQKVGFIYLYGFHKLIIELLSEKCPKILH